MGVVSIASRVDKAYSIEKDHQHMKRTIKAAEFIANLEKTSKIMMYEMDINTKNCKNTVIKQIGEDWVNLEGIPAQYLKEDIEFHDQKNPKGIEKKGNSNTRKEVDVNIKKTDNKSVTLWTPKGRKYGVVTMLQSNKRGGFIAGNQQSQPMWFSTYNCFGKIKPGNSVTYWATHGEGEKPQAVQVETQAEYNGRCNKIREEYEKHSRATQGQQRKSGDINKKGIGQEHAKNNTMQKRKPKLCTMLPKTYEHYSTEINREKIVKLLKDTAEATEGTFEICEDGGSKDEWYFKGTQYKKFWKHSIDKNRVKGGNEPEKISENKERKLHDTNVYKYWLKKKGKPGTNTDQILQKEKEHPGGNPTEMKRSRNEITEEGKHRAELLHLIDRYGRWETGKIISNEKDNMNIANRPVVVLKKIKGENCIVVRLIDEEDEEKATITVSLREFTTDKYTCKELHNAETAQIRKIQSARQNYNETHRALAEIFLASDAMIKTVFEKGPKAVKQLRNQWRHNQNIKTMNEEQKRKHLEKGMKGIEQGSNNTEQKQIISLEQRKPWLRLQEIVIQFFQSYQIEFHSTGKGGEHPQRKIMTWAGDARAAQGIKARDRIKWLARMDFRRGTPKEDPTNARWIEIADVMEKLKHLLSLSILRLWGLL